MIKVLHVYPKNDSLTARFVHLLMDKIESKATDNAAEFKRICQEWQPDIIHQHGSVDKKLQADARWVVSPNGLQSSFDDYYAIVARSPLEAETLRDLGNKRIEVIMNPLVTKQVDFDETAQKLIQVYQKVMNSNPLDLMDEETKEAIPIILKAAIHGDKRWVEQKFPIPSILQLRLLYIYSSLEGVSSLLEKGLAVLGMEQPPRESFECYLPENYAIPSSLSGTNIIKMLDDIQRNGITLIRLVNIYKALISDSHDDERLLALVERNNYNKLFISVLQILKEQLHLDEGFFPCPPEDNHTTRKLREDLQNHLRL